MSGNYVTLVFRGETGKLALYLCTFHSAFHLHFYMLSGNSLLYTVTLLFVSNQFRLVIYLRKKLKLPHEVVFYVQNVARIYPERILPSVKIFNESTCISERKEIDFFSINVASLLDLHLT